MGNDVSTAQLHFPGISKNKVVALFGNQLAEKKIGKKQTNSLHLLIARKTAIKDLSINNFLLQSA